MEDQGGGGSTKQTNNAYVDTSKAERAVWLMKCPPLVSRSFRAPPSDPSRPVAKVVVSIDPLNSNDDDSPPQEKKKTPAKATDTKRTRRDRGEMEEIVFKLFERQPNWSLRNLIQETDQPEQFLKDILKDLCVYNNKGTNQGTYELKPEYRKSGD